MNTETQLVFDFAKPIQGMFNFDNNIYFSSDKGLTLMAIVPPTNVVFLTGEKTIGKLDWSDGTMKFEGDADESAQLFFDNIIKRYVQTTLPIETPKSGWKS